MKIVRVLFVVLVAHFSFAGDDPTGMVGRTIVCKASNPSDLARLQKIELKITSKGQYHRDGLWFGAEFNGPVIHTYVFMSYLRRFPVAGRWFEALIHRDGIERILLEEIPEPPTFRGTAYRSYGYGAAVSLTCSY